MFSTSFNAYTYREKKKSPTSDSTLSDPESSTPFPFAKVNIYSATAKLIPHLFSHKHK